jgi:L-asparaginase
VQTFVSFNRGAIGRVYYGKPRYFNMPVYRRTVQSEFPVPGTTSYPRVDVVYAHEGVDGTMVRAAVAAGAKGIVLAGVGDGNATKDMIDALSAARKDGLVIVRSSHVDFGLVRRNLEIDDDALGFVAAMDLNPQKARVLLRMVLTMSNDVAVVQRVFDEY